MLHIPLSDVTLSDIRRQFNSFFMRSKQVLLHSYLTNTYKRNILAYELVKNDSGIVLSNSVFGIKDDLQKSIQISRRRHNTTNSVCTLPSFISLLFRICYVMKHKAAEIKSEYSKKQLNDEALFRFLFSRLHVF